jgi:hypothetical protein
MLVYHFEKKNVIQEGRSATLQTLRDVGCLEQEDKHIQLARVNLPI